MQVQNENSSHESLKIQSHGNLAYNYYPNYQNSKTSVLMSKIALNMKVIKIGRFDLCLFVGQHLELQLGYVSSFKQDEMSLKSPSNERDECLKSSYLSLAHFLDNIISYKFVQRFKLAKN